MYFIKELPQKNNMFTGIIETTGKIISKYKEHENVYLAVQSSISPELKIDQSLAHNGICLTVIKILDDIHTVCAVQETINKTTLGNWEVNDLINLERCMQLNGRLDGHIVQGHVDGLATCIKRTDLQDNWNFTFQIDEVNAHLIIEKGSITINGTSLTCYHVTKNSFEVTIIPYTFEHTSIARVHEGDNVNIEFDVIGKYVARMKSII